MQHGGVGCILRRVGRQDEDDRIGVGDQCAQALLPILPFDDGVSVDRDRKLFLELEAGYQLVGKPGVGAGIGDENLELGRITHAQHLPTGNSDKGRLRNNNRSDKDVCTSEQAEAA